MRISDWSSDVCSSDLPVFGLAVDPRLAAALREVADARHIIGAFLHADHAARLQKVEEVARLDRLIISRERHARFDSALAFGLGGLEAREQAVGVDRKSTRLNSSH